MYDLTFSENTTIKELQEIAAVAIGILGEVEMTSTKQEQAKRLLSSSQEVHLRQGIAIVRTAQRHAFSRRAFSELKELGVGFKARKAVCDGLSSPIPLEREAALSRLEALRHEAQQWAEKSEVMLAVIQEIVGDHFFMDSVRQPLRGKAERADKLDRDTLKWVHRTLTGLEARFFKGAKS